MSFPTLLNLLGLGCLSAFIQLLFMESVIGKQGPIIGCFFTI